MASEVTALEINSNKESLNSTQQNLMTFRTKGRKMKECELTLHWPEEMKFNALAKNRVTAERLAAALACLRLKVKICCVCFFFN